MMSELKACPFCGNTIMEMEPDFLDTFRVECVNEHCLATLGRSSTEENAIAAWNRRTHDWQALAQEAATCLEIALKSYGPAWNSSELAMRLYDAVEAVHKAGLGVWR
jgi:hypothetical protein